MNYMKNKIFRFSAFLIIFTLILFLLQYWVRSIFLEGVEFYYGLSAIYAFHFISAFFVYGLVLLIYSRFPDSAGFGFIGAGFLKMLAAIVFLLPMLITDMENHFANVLSFFVPYFLYLIFETTFVVKLINR